MNTRAYAETLDPAGAAPADAKRLGASGFALSTAKDTFTRLAGDFDLLLDTVSAPHDLNEYLRLLRPYGTMVIVGAPPKSPDVDPFSLIGGNNKGDVRFRAVVDVATI